MGPPGPATHPRKNLAAGRHRCRACRPRIRQCRLKGCDRRFHPRQARQRYCSENCRKAARKWPRWKAQQRYRDTTVGKEKRNGQSRRYRIRVKNRKPVPSIGVAASLGLVLYFIGAVVTVVRSGWYSHLRFPDTISSVGRSLIGVATGHAVSEWGSRVNTISGRVVF